MCAVKNLIAIKASSRVLNNEATTRNSLLTRFVFFFLSFWKSYSSLRFFIFALRVIKVIWQTSKKNTKLLLESVSALKKRNVCRYKCYFRLLFDYLLRSSHDKLYLFLHLIDTSQKKWVSIYSPPQIAIINFLLRNLYAS